jgi:hypothetical protein
MRAVEWIVSAAFALAVLAGCNSHDAADDDGHEPTDSPAVVSGALTSVPGIDSRTFLGRVAPELEKIDAARAGWQSEVESDAALAQLKSLGKHIEHPAELTGASLRAFLSPAFACGPLRPTEWIHVVENDLVSVRRARPARGTEAKTSGGHQADDFGTALRTLLAPLLDAADVRVEFKLFRVESAENELTTHAYFQASGRTGGGRYQQNGTWVCRWTKPAPDHPPRLLALAIDDFEEIVPGPTGGIRFADCTDSVLGAAPSYGQQLLYGMDHWRDRLQRDYDIDFTGHHGLALGDANGDGLDDLYLCQPGGLPNRLFLRNPDGSLRDVSADSAVDWMELSHAALLVDLDNDNDQDLVVSQNGSALVMRNQGSGHYSRVFTANGPALYFSCAAADYDLDGDLDLYFCGYSPRRGLGGAEEHHQEPTPYHDANNGGRNVLLRNEGGLRFVDATREVGLDENNRRFSFACAWEDYDNDGDPDLYVANDFGRNNLYRNDRGRFRDVAAAAGVEDIAAGMSVAWADFNRDGRMDLYVSNMFSSAGGRIAYQRNFRPGNARETLGQYQRHARGNSLFDNQADGTFADVSDAAAVTMGRWAWGSLFSDLDNDGWEDVYVVNGYITSEHPQDL